MTPRGSRIKQERLRRGMTVAQLAAAAKVSESTVTRVEKGRRDSDLTFLLEECLGIVYHEPADTADGDDRLLTAEDAARRLPNSVLVAEVARRFAQMPGDGSIGEPGEDFTWPTRLGPSATRTDQPGRPNTTESGEQEA